MQPKKKRENDILTEVKKIGRQLEEFQGSTKRAFGIVDQRFDGVDQKFNGVDQKFEGMDRRFEGVDQRFDKMDQKFDGMDQRFEGMDRRFDRVDQRFDGIDKRLDGVDQKFEGIDKRLDGVDQRFDQVDNSIEELAVATAQEFESVRKEMGGMATKTELYELKHEVMQAIDRVDTHLSAVATQWHDDFDEVKDVLKEHDGRLRVLEKYHRPA
ncbi:MAG: hypothetical protein P4L67_03530 [Candidatus Pacebacteria bacterium]|nr:hypothetical protein [Candidatus Paceibacterota bacterium]